MQHLKMPMVIKLEEKRWDKAVCMNTQWKMLFIIYEDSWQGAVIFLCWCSCNEQVCKTNHLQTQSKAAPNQLQIITHHQASLVVHLFAICENIFRLMHVTLLHAWPCNATAFMQNKAWTAFLLICCNMLRWEICPYRYPENQSLLPFTHDLMHERLLYFSRID